MIFTYTHFWAWCLPRNFYFKHLLSLHHTVTVGGAESVLLTVIFWGCKVGPQKIVVYANMAGPALQISEHPGVTYPQTIPSFPAGRIWFYLGIQLGKILIMLFFMVVSFFWQATGLGLGICLNNMAQSGTLLRKLWLIKRYMEERVSLLFNSKYLELGQLPLILRTRKMPGRLQNRNNGQWWYC